MLYTLGRIYFEIGKYDEASFYFGESHKQDVSNGYISLMLGVTDIKNGHNALGCTEMRWALNKGIKEAEDSIKKYCQ